jgi:hypothetical protein
MPAEMVLNLSALVRAGTESRDEFPDLVRFPHSENIRKSAEN